MYKFGFIIADNEKYGGKNRKNLRSNLKFKDNTYKTGQATRNKPPFYGIMHVIKHKYTISPHTPLHTMFYSITANGIP